MSVRTRLRAALADLARAHELLADAHTENEGHVRHIGSLCRDKSRLDDDLRAARAEVEQLRRELADARTPDIAWLAERRDLRRRLLLLLSTNARLESRLHDLQEANDHLSRQAVDRAGNLRIEVPA